MVGKQMKKQLIIISIIVVIVSIFVSCSVNSSNEDISTTAVTDSNGTTHYYEPVTDDKGNMSTTAKNQGVFIEIETQSNGKAVTKKDGTYVTNEHTTVLPIENTTDNSSSTTKSTTEKPSGTTNNNADNNIDFEPEKPTEDTTPTSSTTTEKQTTTKAETTTQKSTEPATDKDGWITKWY